MTDPQLLQSATQGKVLYIEDQEINMVLVGALLADMPGISLITASTGNEGINLARSERPDLVLLDMYLPDIGGLDVVRSLSVEISQGLRVIILTADTLSIEVVKAMALGASEYWVKPVDSQLFREGIARYLNRAHSEEQAGLPAS